MQQKGRGKKGRKGGGEGRKWEGDDFSALVISITTFLTAVADAFFSQEAEEERGLPPAPDARGTPSGAKH